MLCISGLGELPGPIRQPQHWTQHLSGILDFILVIQYYDYVLTLSREIQFLWPPHNKQGCFTIACLLNRYLPLFGHLSFFVILLVQGDTSVRVCPDLRLALPDLDRPKL
jgi:Family of unknown function (DUF6533)